MASVGMMWHDIWILELVMDVIDPVSVIFALDIEGHWLSLFVDMFSVIFVLLCVHGDCALFALGHFCLGLCVLEVLELIAG